jgi:phosphoribosylformylglycinamidine synthase
MKNDYKGKLDGNEIRISVPPTLLVTAVAKVADTRQARTADFKAVGDAVYLLGGNRIGLEGSECLELLGGKLPVVADRVAEPDWDEANRTYSWIGGAVGREQPKLRSLHDVSDGGLLTAVAEACLARNLGVKLEVPQGAEPWRFSFGEGYHSFVASCQESDVEALESEWRASNVPFKRIGTTQQSEWLELRVADGENVRVETKALRAAWKKEGYWE